jgi:NAD(P)-dependent dehydrogenase (short-subunit alcohol dehydrogenase family)
VHWPEAAAYQVFLLCGSTSNARRQSRQRDGAAQESNRALPYRASGALEVAAIRTRSALYDINVVSTQRVNRATLPQLRNRRSGLLVWVSSSSCARGTPPYLAPYFAAKAGMDAMAVTYARELERWGIETSIIVPGAFTHGTNHFAHTNFAKTVTEAFAAIVPPDADVASRTGGDSEAHQRTVRQAAISRTHRPDAGRRRCDLRGHG